MGKNIYKSVYGNLYLNYIHKYIDTYEYDIIHKMDKIFAYIVDRLIYDIKEYKGNIPYYYVLIVFWLKNISIMNYCVNYVIFSKIINGIYEEDI